jgi:hypothetical protein
LDFLLLLSNLHIRGPPTDFFPTDNDRAGYSVLRLSHDRGRLARDLLNRALVTSCSDELKAVFVKIWIAVIVVILWGLHGIERRWKKVALRDVHIGDEITSSSGSRVVAFIGKTKRGVRSLYELKLHPGMLFTATHPILAEAMTSAGVSFPDLRFVDSTYQRDVPQSNLAVDVCT